MQAESAPHGLNDGDYDAIEAAVMETARGRWFLAEFERRNRGTQFDALMQAIQRLEYSVASIQQPALAAPFAPAGLEDWREETTQIAAPSDTLLARLARVAAPLAKYHTQDQPPSLFSDEVALPEISPFPEMRTDRGTEPGRMKDELHTHEAADHVDMATSLANDVPVPDHVEQTPEPSYHSAHELEDELEEPGVSDASSVAEESLAQSPIETEDHGSPHEQGEVSGILQIIPQTEIDLPAPEISVEAQQLKQKNPQLEAALPQAAAVQDPPDEQKPAPENYRLQTPWMQAANTGIGEVRVNYGTSLNQDYQKKITALAPLDKLSASDKMRLFI